MTSELPNMEAIGYIIHGLIGCSWGHGIASEDDREECPEAAIRMVALHGGPPGAEDIVVRLCPRHLAVVEELTTPSPEGRYD